MIVDGNFFMRLWMKCSGRGVAGLVERRTGYIYIMSSILVGDQLYLLLTKY